MAGFDGISTARLTIRLLCPGDAEAMFGYRTLPEVYAYQAWKPDSLQGLADFAKDNSAEEPFRPGVWTQLALIRKEDGTLVGDMGIMVEMAGFQAELGFTVAPLHQRRGYAEEACGAVLRHLFEARGLHRVFASVDPGNAASRRLLEKLGFRFEAHFVKSYLMRGGWYDDCIYGMLEEEWKARAEFPKQKCGR